MPVGAMIPDWAFRKELKRLDSKLDVEWDTRRQRWKIVRETASPGNLYNYKVDVMTVANPDGSYRPLDQRTIRMLRQADMQTRGANTVLDEIMDEQTRVQESAERDERREEEALIEDEILPRAKRDAESLGALNIPKEDVARMMAGR